MKKKHKINARKYEKKYKKVPKKVPSTKCYKKLAKHLSENFHKYKWYKKSTIKILKRPIGCTLQSTEKKKIKMMTGVEFSLQSLRVELEKL